MPYTTKEGRALPMDKAFSHNNKSFGATWLRLSTPEQKEAEGIKWVTVPEARPCERHLNERKLMSSVRLEIHPTRDCGVQIGVNCLVIICPKIGGVFRQATRDEFNRIEAAINAAESYEDLDAIKQEWPLSPYEQEQVEEVEEALDEDV